MQNFFDFIEYHSTCFGRSLRPSSGVQDCTYSVSYMSYSFVAYSQRTCTLYAQSRTPDDGRSDCPKPVE